ncbi:DNRLRE domain-containing protein [Solirubrobacter phytolaccae]|uniref:DNRLRE domain-containing protein n=1 Tax=Solirubrobacter phytolaccae TaxID=1404360 RepID=A0A9X3SFB3_9ACTN|nr:DNRLRE domain-containing protein [Solirubrobacter phytolaccae]MDA0181247.1 DNRLRE domain-containing protein [Solirubrobacter phytolaccae]
MLSSLVLGTEASASTGVDALSRAGTPLGSLTGTRDATPTVAGAELTSERTRFSRTYQRAGQDGRFITRVSEQPLNFSVDDGATWRPIDNRLLATGGAFAARNAANAFDARLPRSLAAPVRVEADGRWVSFALLGEETAAPTLDGDTATYRVSQEVTARYTVHGAGVREVLSLASAKAPDSFRYRVDASRGLQPRLTRDGGVAFVDAADNVRFGFAAPTIVDAKGVTGRATFGLSRAGSAWTLTVSTDRGWLRDKARAFPVALDPDVYWVDGLLRFSKADQDCFLDSSTPTTSTCSLAYLRVGRTSSGELKPTFRFAVEDAIPPDAQVLEGWFALYHNQSTGSTSPTGIELHRLTVPWTNAATWNTTNGSTAWPAGAIDPAVEGPVRTIGQPGFWTAWEPTELVRKWVARALPNHGFVLQTPTGSPQSQFRFTSSDGDASQAPYIDVDWMPAVGQLGNYTLVDAPDTATHAVRVNPANGNLLVDATDAPFSGFEEGLARTFNSFATWRVWGQLGPGWTNHHGDGLYVGVPDWDGSIQVGLPSGAELTFYPDGGGGYFTPASNHAALSANPDGSYTVRLQPADAAESAYTGFPDPYHWRTQSIVRGASTVTFGQEDANRRRTIVDANRTLLQERDTAGRIDTIVDQTSGRTVNYNHDSGGMLTSVQTPERTSTYTHDGFRGPLTSIAESSGTTMAFGYDGQGRVTSAQRTVGSTVTSTTFAYAAASSPCDPATDATKTTVTSGSVTYTYCSDRTGVVTRVICSCTSTDTTPPVIALDGLLYERGQTTSHTVPDDSDLLVMATDGNSSAPQSGVKQIAINLTGASQVLNGAPTSQVTLTDRAECPGDSCVLDAELEFNPDNYVAPSGMTVTVTATDFANNTATTSFTVVPDGQPDTTDPDDSPAARSVYTCTPDAELATAMGGVGYTTGGTSANPQWTLFYADDTYRVTQCNAADEVTYAERVEAFELPSGTTEYVTTETTRRDRYDQLFVLDAMLVSPDDPAFAAGLAEARSKGIPEPQPPTVGDFEPAASAARSLEELPAGIDENARGCGANSRLSYELYPKWDAREYTYRFNRSGLGGHVRARQRVIEGHQAWNSTRDNCGFRDQVNFRAIYDSSPTNRRFSATQRNCPNGTNATNCANTVDFAEMAAGSCGGMAVPVGCTARSLNANGTRMNEANQRYNTAVRLYLGSVGTNTGQFINPLDNCTKTAAGSPNCYDLYAVAIHETGHSIGLAHDDDALQAMFGVARENSTGWRRLYRGDVNGMRKQYPAQ